MKFAWITDPHFDCVPDHVIGGFGRYINKLDVSFVVITGDIGDTREKLRNLILLGSWCTSPIFFTLGNHDLYDGSVEDAKNEARALCKEFPNLVFLDDEPPYRINKDVALVGNSGIYDCRAGNSDSKFGLHGDWTRISEFKGKSIYDIKTQCHVIAEEMAKTATRTLLDAANEYKHVFFATHIPPFPEATWHMGKRSDSEALPWFCNLTFGRMLADVASEYSDVNFTVLCGHTHSPGEYKHFENLKVLTGGAEYGYPSVWKVIEVPEESDE